MPLSINDFVNLENSQRGIQPEVAAQGPVVANTGALNAVERPEWNILKKDDDRVQFLKQIGYREDQILKPSDPRNLTKDWAVYDPTKNTIHPMNQPGLDWGDITGAVPSIVKGAATAGGATLGAISGAGAGSIPGAALGGAAGAGLEEAGEETLAAKLLGKKFSGKNYDPGEIAKQAVIGGISGVTPGSLTAIKNLATGMPAEEALETWGNTLAGRVATGAAEKGGEDIGKVAQDTQKDAQAIIQQNPESKNTVSNVVNNQLGIKNPYLAKELINGDVDTSNLMEGTGVQKINNAAQNISSVIENGKQMIGQNMDQSIREDLAKEAGVDVSEITDADIANISLKTTNTKAAINSLKSDIENSVIPSDDSEKLLTKLNNWSDKLKGNKNFRYGELKQWTKDVWDAKETALDNGDGSIASKLSQLGAALSKDKNSNEIIANANKPYAEAAKLLENLHTATGVNLIPDPNEIVDPLMAGARPLTMRLSRLANETKVDQIQALDKIEGLLQKQPGFENVSYMDELKSGLLNQALDKSKQNALPIPLAGAMVKQVPFLNQVAKVSPITKAKLFYSGLTKGTNIADQPVNAMFPKISALLPLVQGALNKVPAVPANIIRGASEIGINNLTSPKQSSQRITNPGPTIKLPEGNVPMASIKTLIPPRSNISDLDAKIYQLAGLDKTRRKRIGTFTS